MKKYQMALCALLLSGSALATLCQNHGLAEEPSNSAWVELLKGGDFAENWSTKGNWLKGDSGDVRLEPRPGESGWQRYDAYLISKEKYRDFEFEYEFKVANGSNSGFYFHVGDSADPVSSGIEVQIYDSHPKGDKGELNDHDCGGIIPGIPPTKNASKPAGEWNKMLVTCKGNSLTVILNGVEVNKVDISQGALKSRPAKGHFEFQDHGLPLWLKNIKVRAL